MGFSLWYFVPEILLFIFVVGANLLWPSKRTGCFGIVFSILCFIGAVQGIVFGHVKQRELPAQLEGHVAAVYGVALLICGSIALLISILSIASKGRDSS